MLVREDMVNCRNVWCVLLTSSDVGELLLCSNFGCEAPCIAEFDEVSVSVDGERNTAPIVPSLGMRELVLGAGSYDILLVDDEGST